ncbi:hypothetical protein L0244_37990 [bacterium]|nr:hypothetical protein [bacterium]
MLRLILAVLLVISGIGKLLDRHVASQFIVTLTNSNPLVEQRADGLVIGLSIFEIALAGSLLHRSSVRIGLFILSGILVLFSGILVMVLVRGGSLGSCGCFGIFGEELSLEIALLRNLILLIATLGCYLLLVSSHADVNTHPIDTSKLS